MSDEIFIGGDRRSIAEIKQAQAEAKFSPILDSEENAAKTARLAEALVDMRETEQANAKRAQNVNKWRNEQIESRDAVKAQLEKEGISSVAIDLSDEVYQKISKRQNMLVLGKESDDVRAIQKNMARTASDRHAGIIIGRDSDTKEVTYSLVDLHSTNKTTLWPSGEAGRAVNVPTDDEDASVRLKDGDVFFMGKANPYQFRVIEGHPIIVPKPELAEQAKAVPVLVEEKKENLNVDAVDLSELFDRSVREERGAILEIGASQPGGFDLSKDLLLPSDSTDVSSRHMAISRWSNGEYSIVDRGSTNGTYIDSDSGPRKVDTRAWIPLRNGDIVRLSKPDSKLGAVLRFRIDDNGKAWLEPHKKNDLRSRLTVAGR
jgi:hypothetical protein